MGNGHGGSKGRCSPCLALMGVLLHLYAYIAIASARARAGVRAYTRAFLCYWTCLCCAYLCRVFVQKEVTKYESNLLPQVNSLLNDFGAHVLLEDNDNRKILNKEYWKYYWYLQDINNIFIYDKNPTRNFVSFFQVAGFTVFSSWLFILPTLAYV